MNRLEKGEDNCKRKTAEDSASKASNYNPYFSKEPPMLRFADTFYLNDDQSRKAKDTKMSELLKSKPITSIFNQINNISVNNQETKKNENKFNTS